jgi:hypothetical protein
MTYPAAPGVKSTAQFAVNKGTFQGGRSHTVLLRRLACPNLDPNPFVPGTATPYFADKPFNPYVTVDYLSNVPTNDAVKVLPGDTGLTGQWNTANYMPPDRRRSMARRQPYVAALADLTQQNAPAEPVRATFFKHNNSTEAAETTRHLDVPFDWLVHLDRAPATVAEVLNVSAVPPHRLTQQFVVGKYDQEVAPGLQPDLLSRQLTAEAKYQHLAPWQDQNARLYRALEYFTVGDRSPYPGTGGRVAGLVNVNTAFDRATFEAVIDARLQPGPTVPRKGNFFFENPPVGATPAAGAVTDAWQAIGANSVLQRKQVLLSGTGPAPDRPFWPFAAPVAVSDPALPGYDPQYPNTPYNYPFPPVAVTPPNPPGIGVGDTILGGTFTPQHSPQATPPQVSTDYSPTQGAVNYTAAQPPTAPDLQDPSQKFPPFILNEVLSKISGHVTTRSNTFAVFLTVGFFEVVDDATLPVKLGAEVTTSNGKAIRHQMFSVVDRTNLAIDAGKALNPLPPTATWEPPDPTGRLRQAPTTPVFMSMADTVPAGAGAPPAANQRATPVVVGIAGGLPAGYDALTPVTFKPYQPVSPATTALASPPPPSPPTPQGTYWQPGTCQWMFLDIGAKQEPVQVTLDQTGTRLQLLFPFGARFDHAPGAMLCTYQPGNPGPQGAIDYTSPQYQAVVPYAYIVQ